MDTAIFTPPITFKTLPFAPGEVIKINLFKWPINRGLDSGATAALLWSDETTNNYGFCSYLNSEVHQSNSGYTFKYNDVTIRENCSDGTEKATGDNFLYPIPDGTSKLTIIVNGTTYSGTIIKTDTNFTIDWPDTTGVIISPTSL